MNGVTFVERIKELLKEKGENPAILLKAIGLPKNSITNWEQRGNIPAADIVFKIANYLNVSMEYLVTGEENKSDDFKKLKDFTVDELKFFRFKTEEEKEDEKILLNNYGFLNENNKKIVQALIQCMMVNQD